MDIQLLDHYQNVISCSFHKHIYLYIFEDILYTDRNSSLPGQVGHFASKQACDLVASLLRLIGGGVGRIVYWQKCYVGSVLAKYYSMCLSIRGSTVIILMMQTIVFQTPGCVPKMVYDTYWNKPNIFPVNSKCNIMYYVLAFPRISFSW